MPIRPALRACALVVPCLAAAVAHAAQASPVAEAGLGRGLRLLVLEDHRSPIATTARFELMGSRRNGESFIPLIRRATAADLQRVARAYFRLDRRTVGVLLLGAPPGVGIR